MRRFIRFCIVGGGGFVVDSLVYLFVNIFAPPLISRLVSFSAAVFFTYVFNRLFTFESKDKASATEFAKYYANMVLGGAINIATFYIAINASNFIYAHPVIGIALGSIAGLFVNFLTSRILLCKDGQNLKGKVMTSFCLKNTSNIRETLKKVMQHKYVAPFFAILQASLIFDAVGNIAHPRFLSIYRSASVFNDSISGYIFFLFTVIVCLKYACEKFRIEDCISSCFISLCIVAGQAILATGSFAEHIAAGENLREYAVGFIGWALAIRLTIVLLRKIPQLFQSVSFNLNDYVKAHIFSITWVFLFLIWLPLAIIKYPGGTEWDAYHQIIQFTHGGMTAHWPPASSAFMGIFVLAGKNLFNSYELGLFMCSLAIMCLAITAFAYSVKVLFRLNVPHVVLVGIVLFYAFTPIFPGLATSIVKDTPFSACVLLFVTFLTEEVYGLKHEKKKLHYFLFALIAVSMCLLRNNGIYIVYFCIAFVLFKSLAKKAIQWKYMVGVFLFAIVCNSFYNKVVLPTLKIPAGSVAEALSIPFQQTARYLNKYPKEVTAEEFASIDKVLNAKTIGTAYQSYRSDVVKGTYRENPKYHFEYFKTWVAMGLKHPEVYVDATLNTVTGFYFPDALLGGNHFAIYMVSNSCGYHKEHAIVYKTINTFDNIKWKANAKLQRLSRLPFFYPLCNSATVIWIALSLFVFAIIRKREVVFPLIPSVTGALICFASPTFIWNGARYALPIVFTTLFCLALCVWVKKSDGAR